MSNINFMDLRTQYEGMEEGIKARLHGVLEHGRYCMGPEVMELEAELSKYTGAKHVVGCASGTDALLMPLMAYGIGRGDAVFTTPFTFVATAEVISLLGATPVFVDIDPHTHNIDVAKLEAAIEDVLAAGKLKPKCVIPVDLFGLCADYDGIMALAEKYDLKVLEDAAQSLGARQGDRMAGNLGHVAGTSFYPAKPLGCYGDGGAIFTNDDELVDILTSIRVHGQGTHKYDNVRIGINGRLDSIQAAILLEKMTRFEEEIQARDKVARRYDAQLKHVQKPIIPEDGRCAWALYSIRGERRDALQEHLKEQGVPTVVYYVKSLHLQDAYGDLGYKFGDFPVSEAAQADILSLPMHPFLTDDQVDHVCNAVNSFYS